MLHFNTFTNTISTSRDGTSVCPFIFLFFIPSESCCLNLEIYHPSVLFIVLLIVPTEYRYISQEVLPTNQFYVSEYFSLMHEFDKTWPSWLKVTLQTYLSSFG
ncbi:Uncharacterized protein TCM_002720 [Theobroma cacao]|uniref:Uncharacterized protein n=1 Tax=Theobroma cacao TaxID=3641 RepID=A0A061DMZ8_THECC|nr:Uncharacterized protein TCM_002720 [Theobroma cacao]